jgi:hypothetical protein
MVTRGDSAGRAKTCSPLTVRVGRGMVNARRSNSEKAFPRPRERPAAYRLTSRNTSDQQRATGGWSLPAKPSLRGRPMQGTDRGYEVPDSNPVFHELKRTVPIGMRVSSCWNARSKENRLCFRDNARKKGRTITTVRPRTLSEGIEVRVWYVGFSNAALHIARVRSRVEQGGHTIPEERIRERCTFSRLNLIQLLPI